ncbi:4'-phosphopantetheinyl transferase family protein [Candidatus Rickettsiella viridis]|uniref:4'-phosphopantetheinyl transferase family protein n=1 Tax=Candidatus Rickettsiella viridis TaxID=676208 RepID=UPI000F8499A2
METGLDDQVHVWHTSLEQHIKHYSLFQTWLSEEERIRAENLALALRQRFVLSRGILRKLLSGYSGQSPEKIVFSYTQSGKPVFINHSLKQIEFNLSHSHNRVAFAFTWDTPIGIDIEYKTPRKYLDKIAYRFFTAQDYEQLKSLQGEEKLNTFFELWVRHEALLKALGQRLGTHPLSEYKTNKKPMAITKDKDPCTVLSLTLQADFAAALAIKGENKSLLIRTYDSMT